MNFEWRTLTLGELGRVVTGKTPKTSDPNNFGGTIPFVTPTDMDGQKVVKQTARYLSETGASTVKNSIIPRGSVMVSCIGSDMGKAVVAGHDCISNQQINSIVVDTQFSSDFVYYNLSMRKAELQHLASGGSTMPILNKSSFSAIKIEIPSLLEQREIAALFASLDDRIALLRETNTTLEAIAQALFKSWFVDFDPVRAKQQGCEPEGMDASTAALFPDSFEESELGLVPNGWTTCPVYDLGTYINGAAYKAFDPNLARRGLPIIKIAELKAGVTLQTAYSDVAMPEKYRIQTGDILFSWSGNPDTSIDTFVWAYDQAWLNQHIFRVIPHAVKERSFLLRILKHLRPVFAELARNKQTTGLGHVTVSDLKHLQVIKPKKTVLEYFDKAVAPIHDTMFNNEKIIQNLIALRDTLLPRLISGQLRLPAVEALLKETEETARAV